MLPQDQVQLTFNLLKKHIRERGLKYAEVARKANMSESNLKRIFSLKMCSFDRLVEICIAAETNIFDLMVAASKVSTSEVVLSAEAEAFFYENFDCFIFYRRLAVSTDPKNFLESSKKQNEKTSSFLRKLTSLGLVSITNGKIKVQGTGHLRVSEESKLRKKIEKEWIPWFHKNLFSDPTNQEKRILLASTGLSEKHRLQLIEDMESLLSKYRNIGFVDQRIGAKSVKPVGICIGIGPYRVGLFE